MHEALEKTLRTLRLSGAVQTLETRLQEALGNNLAHQEFLEILLQDELLIRSERALKRRIKKANFRDLKNLEDFNFSFNTTIKRQEIYELASWAKTVEVTHNLELL